MFTKTLLWLVGATVLQAQTYDIVIRNGRVMDPETKLDAVRNVGIQDGRIASISTGALNGRRVIDAQGLIVSPGFIDLHWHGREPASDRYEAMDGVTASLELEIGTADVDGWYRARAGQSMIHHGVAAGHPLCNRRAASTAKYVKMPSAPARLNASRLSSMTFSRSSQPRSAAALNMAYSPLTW